MFWCREGQITSGTLNVKRVSLGSVALTLLSASWATVAGMGFWIVEVLHIDENSQGKSTIGFVKTYNWSIGYKKICICSWQQPRKLKSLCYMRSILTSDECRSCIAGVPSRQYRGSHRLPCFFSLATRPSPSNWQLKFTKIGWTNSFQSSLTISDSILKYT